MPASTPAVAPTPTTKEKPDVRRVGLRQRRHGHEGRARATSFYHYANGTWLEEHADPRGQVELRHVHACSSDQSDERTKEIILNAKGAPGTEERKIADYYAAFMDEAAIEKAGIDADPAGARRRSRRSRTRRALVARVRDERAQLPRRRRSRRASARTTRIPSTTSRTSARAASACPIATCTTPRTSSSTPLRDGYKKYIAHDADARSARRTPTSAPPRSTRSRRSSRRRTGRASRTAIRRRRTTR